MEDDSGLYVLGVIFGIVVLVAWIFSIAKPAWQEETYRNSLVECRYCRAGVPPTAIKCMHCGSEFETGVKFTTLSQEKNFNATKEALNEVAYRKIYCVNCEVSLGIYGNQKHIDCWNCKTTNSV